jgi:hypothetical protein
MIIIVAAHTLIGHVPHKAQATSTTRPRRARGNTRPDLDPRDVRCVGHGHVVHVDVFDEVGFSLVLSKTPDGDSVRAGAVEVLDDDAGRVWFEGDAV